MKNENVGGTWVECYIAPVQNLEKERLFFVMRDRRSDLFHQVACKSCMHTGALLKCPGCDRNCRLLGIAESETRPWANGVKSRSRPQPKRKDTIVLLCRYNIMQREKKKRENTCFSHHLWHRYQAEITQELTQKREGMSWDQDRLCTRHWDGNLRFKAENGLVY